MNHHLHCRTCERFTPHEDMGEQTFPGRIVKMAICTVCGNDQVDITHIPTVKIDELLRLAKIYQATSRELLDQSVKFAKRVERLLEIIEGVLQDENGLHD